MKQTRKQCYIRHDLVIVLDKNSEKHMILPNNSDNFRSLTRVSEPVASTHSKQSTWETPV